METIYDSILEEYGIDKNSCYNRSIRIILQNK